MKTVMVLANNDIGLYNFRRELLERLLNDKYQVIISLPRGERTKDLEKMGCLFVDTELKRHGMNPFQEVQLIRFYKKIIKQHRPDMILSYTIKPNIYGGFAAKHCKVSYIANVTGLGTAIEAGGLKSRILVFLYKKALKHAECVFFQNKSNEEFMREQGVTAKQIRRLPGSGVNIIQHAYEEYPLDKAECIFLFVGRLMRDKGVTELIDAARIIDKKYSKVVFQFVGDCEEEFQVILDGMQLPAKVEFYGQQNDIHSYMKQANAIILPSYHEGMANVLLEAAACGRPVLASDIPGCRETFEEGVSGFGFKAKDVESIVGAIEKFLSLDQDKRREMGIAGRRKMEREFNRDIVIDAYMEIIQKL